MSFPQLLNHWQSSLLGTGAGGGGSTPLSFIGFSQAALTSGLSETGSGERLGLFVGLSNSTTIPTIDTTPGWTILGSGITGEGRSGIAAYMTDTSFDFGTSTGASRWAFWEFQDAIIHSHAYQTTANTSSISIPAIASLPSGAWVVTASLWGFGSPTAANAHHSLVTLRSSSNGPPGRAFGDTNGVIGTFGSESVGVGANTGGCATVAISIQPG